MTRVVRLMRLLVAFWLSLAVLAAVVVFAPPRDDWLVRLALGWDAGVAVFLAMTLNALRNARSPAAIRSRAAEFDRTGRAILPLSLLAAVASVVVIVTGAASDERASLGAATFSLVTVALSWLFVHVIFALHYAHEFYAPAPNGKGDRGGLIFPGEEDADYWDFLHFGLIIGVANQTADIQISSRRLRRLATMHCLIAWGFNAVILALAVNLAAALL